MYPGSVTGVRGVARLMSWPRAAVVVLSLFAAVYGAALGDLWLRARGAYMEGEKHLARHRDPSLKAAAVTAEFAAREAALRRERDAGGVTPAAFDARLDLLKLERDRSLKESSLKYAHAWFQTAVELFSPPESRWVRLSRERLSQTRELWKAELKAKGIPYQDYMLE